MYKKTFIGLLILLVTGIFYACNNDPSLNFEEINENEIARFTANNPTDRDIDSLKVEITYISESGETLKTDSVNYSMEELDEPFLKAGEETSIVQIVPPGTTTVEGRLINIGYRE